MNNSHVPNEKGQQADHLDDEENDEDFPMREWFSEC